jgi:hypothetical protein
LFELRSALGENQNLFYEGLPGACFITQLHDGDDHLSSPSNISCKTRLLLQIQQCFDRHIQLLSLLQESPVLPPNLATHKNTLVARRAAQSSIHLFVCTKTKFPTPGCNAVVAIRLSEDRFSDSLLFRKKMDACSHEEFREAQTAIAKNLAHLAF